MPIFYYFSVKGKISKKFTFLHFETLALDYEFWKKITKPNFEFGTSFILRLFSKYALKMPKNGPKIVKISILSPLEGVLEKMWESIPPLKFDFMGGLFSTTFSESASNRLKIEILTFYGSFLGILRAYFEKSHKIKLVLNSKLSLVTFWQNS